MTRRKEVFSSLNIVPYLDVMLVLLVIFMATTPMVQTGVQVNLPSGKAAALTAQKPVVFIIDKSGKYYLQHGSEAAVDVSDAKGIHAWLSARGIKQDHAIHLQADRTLSWQRVLRALVQVNQMGWTKVALSTQAEEAD